MAVSGFVKTNVSGAITLLDGAATPVELTLAFDRGDLSLSTLKEVLNEDVAIERRGRFINSAHGARVYPSISFSCWISAFQDSGVAPGNILTWIQRTASSAYASLVSTLGTGSSVPFACDLRYTLEGTDFGDSADHTFTCNDVQLQIDSFTEAAEGLSVAISGMVRGGITGDLAMAQVA